MMNDTKSLSEILRGKNNCARVFCVFPTHERLMEELIKHQYLFNCEFGSHDTKLLLSIDIPLYYAAFLCGELGLGRFLFVRLSDAGMSAESYVQLFSDQLSFKKLQQQYVMVDSSDEKPYIQCVKNGYIELKSKIFDVHIPLDTYCNAVEKMDEIITERRRQYEEYDELYETTLRSSIVDWGTAKEYRFCQSLLFGAHFYRHFAYEEHDNQ